MLHPVVRGSPHIGRAQKRAGRAALSRPSPLPSAVQVCFGRISFCDFLQKICATPSLSPLPPLLFGQGLLTLSDSAWETFIKRSLISNNVIDQFLIL